MAEHNLTAADIERIDTVVNKMTYDNLMYDAPVNDMEARFSMQFGLALILERGRMGRTDFLPDAIADPALRAWLPRISMTESPENDRLPTADNGREPAQITVHTKDGRTVETFVMHAKGVLQNPMSDDEMWAKYDDCVGDILDAGRAAELRAALEGFETLDRLADLMELIRW